MAGVEPLRLGPTPAGSEGQRPSADSPAERAGLLYRILRSATRRGYSSPGIPRFGPGTHRSPIAELCGAKILVVPEPGGEVPNGLRSVSVAGEPDIAEPSPFPTSMSGDVAFLQYTSGSTGTAKGVILTHEGLLHQRAADDRRHGASQHGLLCKLAAGLPRHGAHPDDDRAFLSGR